MSAKLQLSLDELARQYLVQHQLVRHAGQFYRYVGSNWLPLSRDVEREMAYDAMGAAEIEPTLSRANGFLDALVARCRKLETAGTWLGGSPIKYPLSCGNGIVDLNSGKLIPHTPAYFNLHALDYDYEEMGAPPHRWLRFLESVWDDPEPIEALQKYFGYVLSGETSMQRMLQLVGPRRSGKGTIVRALISVIGEANICSPSLHLISDRFTLMTSIGKMALLFSEARFDRGTKKGAIVDALLRITGEDAFTIDRKYIDAWTGKIPARIVIQTNEVLDLSDDTGALASRLIVLPLRKSFAGEEDLGLSAAIHAERGAILRWSIEGWKKLVATGGMINQPKIGLEVLERTRRQSSPIAGFLEECCEFGDFSVEKQKFYGAYRRWCTNNNQFPLALPRLTEKLEGNYSVKAKKGRWIDKARNQREPNRYVGLRLVDDATKRMEDAVEF